MSQPPLGNSAFGVAALIARNSAPHHDAAPAADPVATPPMTIIDDNGPPIPGGPGRRISYNDRPHIPRVPRENGGGHGNMGRRASAGGGGGVHNTADTIVLSEVIEVFGADIRENSGNFENSYRLRMRDGSMRMITYEKVDEYGLRPKVNYYWKMRPYLTDLQKRARKANAY